MNNKYIDNKIKAFREKFSTASDIVAYAVDEKSDSFLPKPVNHFTMDQVEQFIKEALSQQREEIVGEMIDQLKECRSEIKSIGGIASSFISNDDLIKQQCARAESYITKKINHYDKLKSEQVVNSPVKVVNKVVKSEQDVNKTTTNLSKLDEDVRKEGCLCICHSLEDHEYLLCTHCQKPEDCNHKGRIMNIGNDIYKCMACGVIPEEQV